MSHKRSKVLSTIRALSEKPESTLTQPEADTEAGQPSLQIELNSVTDETGLKHHEPEAPSNDLVASLLATSVIEDQLSELATGTAEALHITEVATTEGVTLESSIQSGGADADDVAVAGEGAGEAADEVITAPEQPLAQATKPEQPAPQSDMTEETSQAIAPPSEAGEILKRPEAFMLIAITFFWAIWRAYAGIWKRPVASRKQSGR
jgi:hypothetical protein